MQISPSTKRDRAMTLVEVLVVVVIVGFLTFIVLGQLGRAHSTSMPISCANNLRQTALAVRVWEGDNKDKYPWQVPAAQGGSMDFITGPNAFRHLQVMSNELSTPKVVFCPMETDRDRFVATNFSAFCNSNVSFFIGVDSSETNATMLLAGDHNITNGTPVRNGILNLTTNHLSGWTAELHNKVGNIALADGSVQQVSIAGLQTAVANSGATSNRLQMPILGP